MNNENEIHMIGTEEPADSNEVSLQSRTPEHHIVSRTNFPSVSRQRINSADLMKAHVALMEKEVILLKQADLFRLVQHHYRRLQTWHDSYTGWRIQRSSTVIRLVRRPSALTPGYLYERLKEPRDFACLTWTFWYAENRQLSGRGNDQQFLLSQLAEQIQEQSAQGTQSEAKFDFRRPADRYSIQRALQYLEDLGGLQLVDGQTKEWVEQTPNADVLYEFTDVIHSLVAALQPHVLNTIARQFSDDNDQYSQGTVLRPTLLPHTAEAVSDLTRAWRTVLLGPALFQFDDPAAFAALRAHADDVANELLETFGWLLDIRRDYACIIRASGTSTGPVTPMTLFGASDQIAMLLCAAIRTQVESRAWPAPDGYGRLHVTTEDMANLFYSLREQYGENWGTDARNKSSRSLLNEVYRKMRQLGLLRGPDETGNVLILPTAARYSASYDKTGQEPSHSGMRLASKDSNASIAMKLPGLDETKQ